MPMQGGYNAPPQQNQAQPGQMPQQQMPMQGGYNAPPQQNQAQPGQMPQQQMPPQQYNIPAQQQYAGQAPMPNRYSGAGVATKQQINNPKIIIGIGVAALVVIVLIIVLAVNLFSGGSSDDPNIGVWTADEITMAGITMNPTEIYADGISLELKSNGNCTLTLDGDDYNADYEIDGTTFTLIDGGDEFPGTIQGNVITITNLLDMGIDIVFVKDGMTGEDSGDMQGAGVVIDENNLTGTYMLSSMTTAGVVMNYDAIQQAEIEMTLEIDGENGTLVAYGSASDVELDVSAKTMLLQGLVLDYVIDGDSIVAAGDNAGHEIVFVFTAENSSIWGDTSGGGINATGFVPPGYGSEVTMPVETLSNPSIWYGIVTISDYVGNDDISGEYEAWGYIGNDEIGDYFELYLNGYVDSEDYINFMSFNIELHDYSFFPVVDEHAWLYGDATLKEEDNTWYVPNLTNGILGATYEYDYNGESFTIDFQIAQVVEDGATSNEESDTDSDVPAPEPTPAPEPETAAPSFTKDELRDVYLAIQELSIDEKFSLTEQEVFDRYFNGIAGNVTNEGDTFISYQWISVESETSLLNISFDKNDDGTRTYKSMSINNIDYE